MAGVATDTPAVGLINQATQGVGDRVQVRANPQAIQPEIVTRIHDNA